MDLIKFTKNKQWAWRTLCNREDGELNPFAEVVLADLRNFCYGTKSPYSDDALMMARLVGRQEVYQRVMNFLNVDYAKQLSIEEDYLDD